MSGLQELGSSGHGVDDELDTIGGGDADLEHAAGGVGTYQHVKSSRSNTLIGCR